MAERGGRLTHPNDGESFPPPATSPDASPGPLPRHDSLPAELLGEVPTERPPATLDEIRDLLGLVLKEQTDGFTLAFERIGGCYVAIERLERLQEALAIESDKRAEAAVTAARDAANAALEAAGRIEQLRQSIDDQFGTKHNARAGE